MQIRPADPADTFGMAHVYILTWQEVYQGIVPDRYLDAMKLRQYRQEFLNDLKRRHTVGWVAQTDQNGIVGFITGGRERNRDSIYLGEIYALYVLKAYRKQGLGKQLMHRLAAHFKASGLYSMMVWVLGRNPHRRFYEKLNGMLLRSRPIVFTGIKLDAVAYGWISVDLVQNG